MKQLFQKLKDLIKRGILRIFPLPQKVLYITLALSALLLIGCSTPRYTTQLVHDIQRDTIYLSNTQYDSIYIYKDRLTERSRDTVYLKDISIEYRYKMLRDTIRVIQRDSIPYEVVCIETKEITRPLTWFDHLTRAMALAMAICLVTYFLKKTRYSYFDILKIFK